MDQSDTLRPEGETLGLRAGDEESLVLRAGDEELLGLSAGDEESLVYVQVMKSRWSQCR